MMKVSPKGIFRRYQMRLRMVLTLAAMVAVLAAVPVRVAHAKEHRGWGDYDEHHEWRGADWWHEHHPVWFWDHHPEWAANHPRWRYSDGDWDDHHHWHDREWWYGRDHRWVEKHHPHWKRWHDDRD
jgi:hypothetical protein